MEKTDCKSCRIRKDIIEYVGRNKKVLLKYREIGRIINVKHPQTVKHYIDKLIKEGILDKQENGCGHEIYIILKVKVCICKNRQEGDIHEAQCNSANYPVMTGGKPLIIYYEPISYQ